MKYFSSLSGAALFQLLSPLFPILELPFLKFGITHDVLMREDHSEPILLIPPSLVEAQPLLASLPFGTVHPVSTVRSPTIDCYSEYNQCHEQE
jgi:hypothetical protein